LRRRISESVKALQNDPEYVARQRAADAIRAEKSRESALEHWADSEARERHIKGIKAGWENEERRKRLSERNRERWKDPDYRAKMIAKCQERLSDVPRVAKVLNVGRSTVAGWCRKGLLGKKVGGRWVITDEEVERFLESRERKETRQ